MRRKMSWDGMRTGRSGHRAVALAAVAAGLLGMAVAVAPSAHAAEVLVGLITKTDTNPFFVKMKEGAEAKAKELGIKLQSLRRQGRRRQRNPGRGDREPASPTAPRAS